MKKIEETIELDFNFFTPEENQYRDCWKAQVKVNFKVGDCVVYYDWFPFNCNKELTKEEIIEKITLKKDKLIELAKEYRKLHNSGFWWVE